MDQNRTQAHRSPRHDLFGERFGLFEARVLPKVSPIYADSKSILAATIIQINWPVWGKFKEVLQRT